MAGTEKETALTGLQKAAILLIALGPERSALIFQHLQEEEIEDLTLEIANTRSVTPQAKEEVINEFYGVCLAQQYLHLVKMPGNFVVSYYPVQLQLTDLLLIFVSVAAWDTHRMGAGWLAENIAKPLTAFLLLPEQQLESRTAATPGTLNYCIAIYSSNTPPFRTNASELRGSLLLEFPNDEIVHNQAISIEDAANDFAVVKP